MGSAPSKTAIIQNLVERGWIPLRQAAILLNYGELRGIYAKQRSKNPIPAIRIGGTIRVYPDDLFEALRTSPKCEGEYEALRALYITAQKLHERSQASGVVIHNDEEYDEDA